MKGASRVAIRTEEHKVSTSLTCTPQPSGSEGVMRTDRGLCAMTTSAFVIHSYRGPPSSQTSSILGADSVSRKISLGITERVLPLSKSRLGGQSNCTKQTRKASKMFHLQIVSGELQEKSCERSMIAAKNVF